jgi:hypothetical protein
LNSVVTWTPTERETAEEEEEDMMLPPPDYLVCVSLERDQGQSRGRLKASPTMVELLKGVRLGMRGFIGLLLRSCELFLREPEMLDMPTNCTGSR